MRLSWFRRRGASATPNGPETGLPGDPSTTIDPRATTDPPATTDPRATTDPPAKTDPPTTTRRAGGRLWTWLRSLHPLLFAAYFVLFVFAQNLGEVELDDVAPVLLLAVAAALALLIAATLLLRDPRRGALVASAVVIVFFGYGHVANALVAYRVPGFVQQGAWAAVFLLAIVVSVRAKARLGQITSALNAVATVLVVLSLVQVVPEQVSRTSAARAPSPFAIKAGAVPVGPQRDVWYLIFDRYASDRELGAAYQIDSDLDDWLTGHGFYVAQDSQANYVKTSLSIASSLNLAYLDDVVKRMGPDSDDHGPIFAMMKDHVLGQFLKSQGYEFVQVGSPYGPTNVNEFADRNPRVDSTSDFATAIYDTSVLPAVGRRLGLIKATPERQRYYDIARFQWATVQKLAADTDDTRPKLVFCHFLLPHPPYVFAADGSFVAEDKNPRDVAANYGRQLQYTNAQIKAFMTTLLAVPEAQRPIILLQADEGPYPARYNANTLTFDWSTATDAEIRMKYGILDAYYLPGVTTTGLYPSITPVNSWRLILGDYFGTDTPLLPDRMYTSRGKFRPYDMTDVTSRLTPIPSPAPP